MVGDAHSGHLDQPQACQTGRRVGFGVVHGHGTRHGLDMHLSVALVFEPWAARAQGADVMNQAMLSQILQAARLTVTRQVPWAYAVAHAQLANRSRHHVQVVQHTNSQHTVEAFAQ